LEDLRWYLNVLWLLAPSYGAAQVGTRRKALRGNRQGTILKAIQRDGLGNCTKTGFTVADGDGEIAEAIEELRAQLTAVQAGSADARLHFAVTEVEMEFLVTVSKGGGGNAGIRLGLVSVGADGHLSKDSTHRLKLRLEVRDSTAGDNGPATVSGRR
jgi:hypothetical protein